MRPERTNRQVIAICVIIAAAFVSSALLFYRSSIAIAAAQAETFTTYVVKNTLDETSIANGTAANEAALRRIDDLYDQEAFFIEPSGEVVLAATDSSWAGTNAFDSADVAVLDGTLSADDSQTFSHWSGKDELFGKSQRYVEAHYDKDLSLYLVVVNDASEAFFTQRQQMATVSVMLFLLVVLIISLITYLIRDYRGRIIKLATTDEVTGLANRKSFVEAYERLKERGELDGAVAFLLDIDLFKKINDSYGHTVGDEALLSVAQQVKRLVGETGCAGRWGGDEFIGILRMPSDEAFDSIRTMVATIASSEPVPGLHVSVSIGAAKIDSSTALNHAVETSDEALYLSKKNGRGFLTVYEEGKTPKISYAAETPNQREELGVAAAERTAGRSGRTAGRPERREKGAQHLLDRLVTSLLYAVRWMIPFVAGGGLLIAVAFLIDGASVDVGTLAAEARSSFGSITPLSAALFAVGSAAFNFMLPIFAGFLARSLAGDDAFMAGFVGGYISSQGSSGFLGAILAGFITALIIKLMSSFFEEMPLGLRRTAPILFYPALSLLVMYVLTTLVVNPFVVVFNEALTSMLEGLQSNSIVLGACSGAMMATDMGGPINKAAYHFGTAGIQSGRIDIMAAVMVGGMVPPCGIALSTLLFKHKFTSEERHQAPLTMVMGLSFVTEGALPYLLTDIFRVIPSCMVGSATAGALSEFFGCTLMAPHGGVFVFPVVNLPFHYLAALGAGSVVTAVILGLLKRPVKDDGECDALLRGAVMSTPGAEGRCVKDSSFPGEEEIS